MLFHLFKIYQMWHDSFDYFLDHQSPVNILYTCNICEQVEFQIKLDLIKPALEV